MIENVMQGIGGVGWFGVISICLFFGFFTGMFFWAIRLNKTYLKSMQGLPLDNEAGTKGSMPSQSTTELVHE